MANTLYQLTTSKTILTRTHSKKESPKTLLSLFKDQYNRLNHWLGIDECVSDRIYYYGTLFLMFFIPTVTYIISEMLF